MKKFSELQSRIVPLLEGNKRIYETYYLGYNEKLCDKFQNKILVNNEGTKSLLIKNMNLIQMYNNEEASNVVIINKLIMHIDEFRETRGDDEKTRLVLFLE